MPIKHTIWKVGPRPTPLATTALAKEDLLEDMITREPTILSPEWMLIGRQESTGLGGRIDLLAIAPDASLVLIELKRNRTAREVVAQAIDYASWVENLTAERIAQIYGRFSSGGSLDVAFQSRFGRELDEEVLNNSHQIVVVAAELDDVSERIIQYLNARDIAINVLYFQVFQHGSEQLLSRAWLIDPGETQANAANTPTRSKVKEPWNGEFYVSFGGDCTWSDARAHGFISAGGGNWYTQTLNLLSAGDRVWVNIPKKGYVGVGRVTDPAQSVNEFKVQTPEGPRFARDVLSTAARLKETAVDPERAEQFVRMQWLDTVTEDRAFTEVGLFGNQNTVCQPTTPKWRHTVERLKLHFPKWNTNNLAVT
jgi:Endonuclease NucS